MMLSENAASTGRPQHFRCVFPYFLISDSRLVISMRCLETQTLLHFQVLHVGRTVPVTITLKNLLEKSFPEEYAARREEEGPAPAPSGNAPLPLFVMACILPGAGRSPLSNLQSVLQGDDETGPPCSPIRKS